MTGTVTPAARRIAAQIADAFDRDQQLAVALNEAQQRLQAANERLWRGLHPDGLAAVYGHLPQFETVQLEASLDSGSEVLSSPDPLGAIQEVFWEIHRAFNGYQHAAEDRRMLASEIGELIRGLITELQSVGWDEQEARNANVRELAQGGL
jgi:hypothetical protein